MDNQLFVYGVCKQTYLVIARMKEAGETRDGLDPDYYAPQPNDDVMVVVTDEVSYMHAREFQNRDRTGFVSVLDLTGQWAEELQKFARGKDVVYSGMEEFDEFFPPPAKAA